MSLVVATISPQGRFDTSMLVNEGDGLAVYACSDALLFVFQDEKNSDSKKKHDMAHRSAKSYIESCYPLGCLLIQNNGEYATIHRDQSGQQTVFYAKFEDKLYVSDSFVEITRAIGKVAALTANREAIRQFIFHRCMPSPLTIVEDIYQVSAGAQVICSPEPRVVMRSCIALQEDHGRSPSERRSILLAALRNSAREAVDHGFGTHAHLSGGVDSAICCALIRELGNVKAVTLGFSDAHYDESGYAAETARMLEIDHRVFMARPLTMKEIGSIMSNVDQPYGYPAYLSTHLLAESIGYETNKVLTGDWAGVPLGLVEAADSMELSISRWRAAFGMGNDFDGKRRIPLLVALHYLAAIAGRWGHTWLEERIRTYEPHAYSSVVSFLASQQESRSSDIFGLFGKRLGWYWERDELFRSLWRDDYDHTDPASIAWDLYVQGYRIPGVIVKTMMASRFFDTAARNILATEDVRRAAMAIPDTERRSKRVLFEIAEMIAGQKFRRILDRPKHGFSYDIRPLIPDMTVATSCFLSDRRLLDWLNLDRRGLKRFLNILRLQKGHYMRIWTIFVLLTWVNRNILGST